MFSGRMRIAQDHLNARVSEHRGESNQVDAGHGSASRPSMTKIVESKMWNPAMRFVKGMNSTSQVKSLSSVSLVPSTNYRASYLLDSSLI